MILFCCVGNAFQSPLLAALYNAEASALGLSARAMSAGLSNRREMPPTTAFLLAAVAQEVRDRPAVYAALSVHQPTPLKTLPFVPLRGVSYLYDPSRKAGDLTQDAKVIDKWLAPAPTTPVMRLAIKDAGYEAWEAAGRPALESPAGQGVLAVYAREVVALRALVNALVAATASEAQSAPEAASVSEPGSAERERAELERAEAERQAGEAARREAARVEASRVDAAREAARIEAARVEAARIEAARIEAARVEAARVEAARMEAARLEAAREAARIEAAREAARVEAARAEAARLAALHAERMRLAEAQAEEAKRAEPARRTDQVATARLPTAPIQGACVGAEAARASEATRTEATRTEGEAVAARIEAVRAEAARMKAAREAARAEAARAEATRAEATRAEATRAEAAPTLHEQAPEGAYVEVARALAERLRASVEARVLASMEGAGVAPSATTEAETKKPGRAAARKPKKTPQDPSPGLRDEVLDDVRAWLRAALPVTRAVLTRYGLWQRAQTEFGSWSEAVSVAGIVAAEPLWTLPRDRELSLDILIEALPDANVARLTDLSLAKVRARRRANGAPDPARQLLRRVVATDQLGVLSDEAIAARLGIRAADVTTIREAEGIAPPA